MLAAAVQPPVVAPADDATAAAATASTAQIADAAKTLVLTITPLTSPRSSRSSVPPQTQRIPYKTLTIGNSRSPPRPATLRPESTSRRLTWSASQPSMNAVSPPPHARLTCAGDNSNLRGQ
jgi:hypothetical protein